jgi:hypothetical protein
MIAEDVARMRMDYDMLVKLKRDDLLERKNLSADARAPHGYPQTTTVES